MTQSLIEHQAIGQDSETIIQLTWNRTANISQCIYFIVIILVAACNNTLVSRQNTISCQVECLAEAFTFKNFISIKIYTTFEIS